MNLRLPASPTKEGSSDDRSGSLSAPVLDRLLTLREVCVLTSLSKTSIYNKVNDGSFPAQIPLGPNRVGWSAHDIAQWRQRCRQAKRYPAKARGSIVPGHAA